MSTDQFDDLLKRMPKIADAVNAFKSEDVQQSAFRVLVEAIGIEVPEQGGMQTKDTPSPSRKKTRRKKGHSAKQDPALAGEGEKPKRKARTSQGPGSVLDQLIEDGFFAERRILRDIIEHCKHHKAKIFKANELSSPLSRFTRQGKLTRQLNSDGQYEYQKA